MEATSISMMNPSSSCCLKKHMYLSSTSFNYRNRNSLKMGGFCDKGQLEYYKYSIRIRCGSDKKKMKKRGVKLLKGLSRDLNEFYGMGFGLDSQYYQQNQENHGGLDDDQVKFKMMSEAAELLIEQLRKVRTEDKELKKKMKMEEKEKKKKKAEKRSASCLESESSSSESSDSESDNEMAVDLNLLNRCLQPPPASVSTVAEFSVSVPSIPTLQENGGVYLLPTTAAAGEETERRIGEESVISRLSIGLNQEKNRLGVGLGGMVGKKIEVCMGGKCKKSGAATLIEEFQRVVGFNDDVVVSGCKCMGKCREGPNVRVVNTPSSAAAPMAMAVAPGNPLCLGVGVDDVGLIVSNFFGDESQQNPSIYGYSCCCNVEKVSV